METKYWVAIAFAVVALLIMYGDRLLPLLAKAKSIGGTAPAGDEGADWEAIRRLHSRFERLQCKEGIAAIQTALAHFFHTPGHHP